MRFSKWHGLGNDYLVLERAELGRPLTPAAARLLCDVHRGVGADGVLEVTAVDGARAEIVIWNPDGSTAELSGNGTRIAARWLALRAGAAEVTIGVGPREVSARLRGGLEVEADMGEVEAFRPEVVEVAGAGVELTPVVVGNPHAVVRRDPEREVLLGLGPLLEQHPRFPARTNVQLVRVDGPHDVTAAIWERGAGETLASGTSSVAVAAAAAANGWCESPVRVHLAGGDLVVVLAPAGERVYRATLTGPAQEICTGELSPELALPL